MDAGLPGDDGGDKPDGLPLPVSRRHACPVLGVLSDRADNREPFDLSLPSPGDLAPDLCDHRRDGVYFNVFVLVVQLFRRVPALSAMAPTQSEPPFQIAHSPCCSVRGDWNSRRDRKAATRACPVIHQSEGSFTNENESFGWVVARSLLCASLLFAQALPEMRMLPAEMRGGEVDGNQIGSSGLAGVHTKVLFGDPSKAGFYSILLFVPAHTTIQGHSHRDDRMATVVSGTWYFGYGDRFDAKSLKKLPPGSVYSEPGAHNHFARTDKDAVIVQISGYGPTDTRYFNPADEPKPAQ